MLRFLFYPAIVVFSIGCFIRLIPIIQNYPYPIGYDSINYYLPTLYNLHFSGINGDTLYPGYIFLVYFFSTVSFSDPYISFNIVNVILNGSLSVTTFFLIKKMLRLSDGRSMLFAIFVIFQLGILRISWDLYRDMLSLIFFNLYLIVLNNLWSSTAKQSIFVPYFTVFVLSVITIITDRMIGILLITTSFIISIVTKNKLLFAINSFFLIIFLMYFFYLDDITFISLNSNFFEVLVNSEYTKNGPSQYDLLVLFLSLYGVILPFFFIGFAKMPNSMFLKIPTLITLIFSFSWTIIPNYIYLVPERWMILSGFFISIFGFYGFLIIVERIKSPAIKKVLSFSFLISFVCYGILFVIIPYGVIFTIPSVFHTQTEFIIPLSMSFNSLEISKNNDLVESIEWINTNTGNNSIIIGTKHWRGWFNLFLEAPRQYVFNESITKSSNLLNYEKYTIAFSSILKSELSYECKNDDIEFSNTFNRIEKDHNIYMIDLVGKFPIHYQLVHVVYQSKYFIIYDLTNMICM